MNRIALTGIKAAPIVFGLVLAPCPSVEAQGAGSASQAAGLSPALTLLSATNAQDPPPPPVPGIESPAAADRSQVPSALPLPSAPGDSRKAAGTSSAPAVGQKQQARGEKPTTARPTPVPPIPGPGAGADGKDAAAGGSAQPQEVRFDDDGLVTLHTNELDVRQLLELLSRRGRLNILVSPKVSGTITANFERIALEDLLKSVLKLADLVEKNEGGIRFVYSREEIKDEAEYRKKEKIITKVYRLNYVRADELMVMLTPFLSEDVGRKRFATTPNYQYGVSEASTLATGGSMGSGSAGGMVGGGGVGSGAVVSGGAGTIQRGTQPPTGGASMSGNDVLVIQDYESNLKIIDQIVARLDVQPVQVLIEAVIISVELDKEQQLGVNFAVVDNLGQQLGVIGAGAAINGNVGFTPAQVLTAAGKIATNSAAADATGFASTTNGIKYGFVSNNVTGFIRALETVGSTKVLASPRVLVLNKQRAEIQLGSRLGFRTLSQNFTSTIQQVQFLNVGTLLRLRPFVSNDGMVRLEIHPERSQGVVVDDLPSATTAELTTNVMVPDGATLVIGGLMEDEDDYTAQGLPGLSRVPLLGHLFGNKDKIDRRRELVVLLTPHIWSAELGREMGEASLRKPGAMVASSEASPRPTASGNGAAGAAAIRTAAATNASSPAPASPTGRTTWTRGRRGGVTLAGSRDLAIAPAGARGVPTAPSNAPAATGADMKLEPAPGSAHPGGAGPAAVSPSPSSAPADIQRAFFSGTLLLRSEEIQPTKADVPDTLESAPQAPDVVASRPPAPSRQGPAKPGEPRTSARPKADPAVSLASMAISETPRPAGPQIPDLTPVPVSVPQAAAVRRHVVAAGEDFGTIAERYYGSADLGRALWWANRSAIAWPGALAAGTRLVVPPREQLRDVPATAATSRIQPTSSPRVARQATLDTQIQPATHLDAASQAPAAASAAQPQPMFREPEAEGAVQIHVVRRRETLRSIAQDRLGDPARAGEIAAMNEGMLAEAGGINVGMRLLLPADARSFSPTEAGAGK